MHNLLECVASGVLGGVVRMHMCLSLPQLWSLFSDAYNLGPKYGKNQNDAIGPQYTIEHKRRPKQPR